MTAMLGIVGICLGFVGLGAWLGAERLATLLIGLAVGTILTPWLGPALNSGLTTLTGWNTLAGAAVCWAAAYGAIVLVTGACLRRAVPRTRAWSPSRRAWLSGVGTGVAVGALLGWTLFGNLPDLVLHTLPSGNEETSALNLHRPWQVLRACRLLRSVNGDEGTWLASRPDVQAVLESPSIESLLEAPDMLQKVSSALDGDWLVIGELAADPAVKAAMDDPEFLERVRAVDVVALAEAVEQRRRGTADSEPTDFATVHLPRIVREVSFQQRVLDQWMHDGPGFVIQDSSRPGSDDTHTAAERAETYWRNVGPALQLFDRPAGTPAWMAMVSRPLLSKLLVAPEEAIVE